MSTDHAPHKPSEKALPFDRVPAGISSADLVLPLMSTLVARGELAFRDVVRLCISNPVAIHGLLQGGGLEEGGAADLVIFDPKEEWVVTRDDFLSRASASPYVGMTLTGRVAATLVDGKSVYVDSKGPLAGCLLPGSMRLEPVTAIIHIHKNRYTKLEGTLHSFPHKLLHDFELVQENVEYQLVVYLEDHG